jgi:hypothetical protein
MHEGSAVGSQFSSFFDDNYEVSFFFGLNHPIRLIVELQVELFIHPLQHVTDGFPESKLVVQTSQILILLRN